MQVIKLINKKNKFIQCNNIQKYVVYKYLQNNTFMFMLYKELCNCINF